MLLTEKDLDQVTTTYKNGKKIAFFDHVKTIPSEITGVKDEVFIYGVERDADKKIKKDENGNYIKNKEDYTNKFGHVQKAGEPLVELYIYINDPKDKNSIYKQRVKTRKIDGVGEVLETELHVEAYKKYKEFKSKDCKREKDILLDRVSETNKELIKKLAKLQEEVKEKNKKLEEIVVANSDLEKKLGKTNDTTNNIAKHRKGR